VRFGAWTLDQPQAGSLTRARVEIENTGSVAWRNEIYLAYHWLDDRGNPIVWNGLRTKLPIVRPGEKITVEPNVRSPIPPGRYRFAFDLVAEYRAWFSELGCPMAEADVVVEPRQGIGTSELPPNVTASADRDERVRAAHAEGFAVVAGAVRWSGRLRRHPRELEPYLPGGGRQPGFSHPLICPSVLPGVTLERLPDIAGLPAFAAPPDEPWVYDGRIVLEVAPPR